jgi:DNA-binding response OmpR family regulator
VKTILLVEDEANLRLLYEQELGEEGYKIISVGSGEEALDLFDREPIDLAVLDIKLDRMSGIELLRRMKGKRRDLKVVLNTAYPTYKADFGSWSADAFLVKSADLAQLKTTIQSLLQ